MTLRKAAPSKVRSLTLVKKDVKKAEAKSLPVNATRRKVVVMAPLCITIDFETKPIRRRPEYPPKPTSVVIKYPWQKAKGYAWGHPEDNTCTEAAGYKAVRDAWNYAEKHNVGLLFQNGKFDRDVAEVHCGVQELHWSKYHELQFLLFYNNPHSYNLQLKSQAKELLGIQPDEKDEVTKWLEAKYGKRAQKAGGFEDPRPWKEGYEPDSGRKPERVKWYAMTCLLPGRMSIRLAVGDVDRTDLLFKHLYPVIQNQGMLRAYDRDRQLLPILLENERQGVRVDTAMLAADERLYTKALNEADQWLRKAFHARAVKMRLPKQRQDDMLTLSMSSDRDFGDALADLKLVDDDKWTWTKGGKNSEPIRSVSKKNLTPDMVNDPKVASVYGYRNRLFTVLGTFIRGWLRQARATGGTIHTNWKQVKASDFGGGDTGAATGRLSSSPNFQNIPKDFEDRGDGFVHPAFARLPQLPLARKYLLPDEGHVWGHRDYSQQELRVFAHFAEPWTMPGQKSLAQMYRETPDLDVHGIVDKGLQEFALHFIRTYVKNFVFQTLYGGGLKAVTAALHTSRENARKAMEALREYLPGYGELNDDLKELAADGDSMRTWGGRVYYVEPGRYVEEEHRFMTFEYKMLNYLIQGSSADCTKEALIRYHNHSKRTARFLITVHDEINISIPKGQELEQLAVLRECMESVEFDVPMLSDAKLGTRWSLAGKVYRKGARLLSVVGTDKKKETVTLADIYNEKVVPITVKMKGAGYEKVAA